MLMAIYLKGMNFKESFQLTESMMNVKRTNLIFQKNLTINSHLEWKQV